MSRLKSYALAFILLVFAAPAFAQSEQQVLVDKAFITLRELRANPNLRQPIDKYLSASKGVLIFPNLLKGAFIFGAEGGRGVLLVHNADGSWSSPAFYALGSASIGLQIGAKATSALLIINTQGGLNKIMNNSVKLGADLSLAAGPFGIGGQAATTTNAGADIYQYAESEGAFAGVQLDGSVVSSNDEWNEAYYGRTGIKPTQIVFKGAVHNQGADQLRRALARAD